MMTNVAPNSHYLNLPNANSTSTTTSSIFSDLNKEYESKIREIEEYYIKTLLNDNTDNDESSSSEGHNINEAEILSEYSPRPSPWLPSKPNCYHSLADFKDLIISDSRPANTSHFANLFSTTNNISTLATTDKKRKKRPLEVEINPTYATNAFSLPLTAENLQKLSQVNSQSTGLPFALPIQKTTKLEPCRRAPLDLPQLVNKTLYKTELCESFTIKGYCKYGNKCQFAHGLHELKFKKKSNNYRTKPCINWSKLGYCPYGKRCCFKHGDDKDVQVYQNANNGRDNDMAFSTLPPAIAPANDNNVTNLGKPKNLHTSVKALQRMTW
ncbi:putative mRNA-binding protein CTH1 [Saccharomyces paradoxus]|uniref:mRNA-binding protein CTH1 n=1 Tax=Saccharomyces paradoxus TaxID=27291 RepID=A0A8B8UNQ1_SACPA|nr:Cth1 [Saccharomyces paradoxus]QHS72360.1 Cth1 [Saccharomyces paradoxus]